MSVCVRSTIILLLVFSLFESSIAGGKNEIAMTQRLSGFYTGGNGNDETNGIAIDKDGNFYILGTTNSTAGLIGTGGHQAAFGGGECDAFLIKYDKTGTGVWSTYFGGTGTDKAFSIKLANDNKLYLCGSTTSPNAIATAGAFQPALAGEADAFVACFDLDGKISWATYFGGTASEEAADLAIDLDGSIVVGGTTASAGLSVGKVYQKTLGGMSDGFILKLDATGARTWSTYYGGLDADSIKGVAIQNDYYIAVAGVTKSTTKISTTGVHQDTLGGMKDAFASVFLMGGDLLWGTYLGGKKDDWANDVTCDSQGNVLLTGHTQSTNGIASDSAFQGYMSGLKFGGAFITKLNSYGEMVYSTYYGGSKDFDYGNAIICDSSNSFIVVGNTKCQSPNISVSSQGAWQKALAGEYDAFAVKFNENNTRVWGTFYGGTASDYGNCLAADVSNNIFIGGKTSSPDGISSGNTLATATDGFVAGLSGVGNCIFYVFSNDSSVYPLKITLINQSSGNKWDVKLVVTVPDSITPIIYDTKNEKGIYKLRVEQANKMTYLPSEYSIGDRLSLMKLTYLRPNFTRNNYKLDSNTVSNIAFYTSNNGIFGSNITLNKGGLFWPRGSKNQYMFGGGLWFGAIKASPQDSQPRKYVVMCYNPNNGNSWVVPTRFEENKPYEYALGEKYKVMKSTDYDKTTGKPKTVPADPAWPLWVDNSSYDLMKYGAFIFDDTKRNTTNFPSGPKYFSDEDLYSVYNDYDLDFYDGGKAERQAQGYPLKLQFEQNIYTWASGSFKDAIIISYKVINTSKDTLMKCWVAPVMDFDIQDYGTGTQGSTNDRARYYIEEDTLGLGIGWTNSDVGEAGKGFGYLGYSLLQTPAVSPNGFLKKGKSFFAKKEQLGIQTCRNWGIQDDKATDEELYTFMSSEMLDGDNGPGDKRAMLGTGPFNMLPGDTMKIVLLLNFALPALGTEADGTTGDVAKLIESKRAIDKAWDRYLTDVEEHENQKSSVNLSNPYPNPISGTVNIDFELMTADVVSIDILNLFGYKMLSPVENQYFPAGNHSVKADLKDLKSGYYSAVIRIGNQTTTLKLQVVK